MMQSQSATKETIFTYQIIQRMQEELLKLLNESPDSIYALSKYSEVLNQKIKMGKDMVNKEIHFTKAKGRGGNNTAENVKKMFLALVKRLLPSPLYNQFMDYMTLFHLKSQKENLVIFFLILYKFELEGKISLDLIQRMDMQTKVKISKYMNTSRVKMEQEGRKLFYQKNIRQFEKFLTIDLKFNQKRSFKDVCQNIRVLFLKKKKDFRKAQRKLRNIILKDPLLTNLFHDIEQIQAEETTLYIEPQIQKQDIISAQQNKQTQEDSIQKDANKEEMILVAIQ